MELLRTNVITGEPSVLHVEGELDLATAEELRTALEQAHAADPAVAVDLSGVTFFDAAGLRVLLQVAASRNGAGPLTILNASRGVTRVLEIVGLRDLPSINVCDEQAA